MKRLLTLAALILLAVIIVTFFSWQVFAYEEKIHAGVRINRMDVGGLTQDEVRKKLRDLPPPPKNFFLSFKDYHETIDLSDFRATPNNDLAIKQAYGLGRSRSWPLNLIEIALTWLRPKNILISYHIDTAKLSNRLIKITPQINQPPVTAKRLVSKDKIVIDPGQPGYTLLVDDSIKRIKSALAHKQKRTTLAVKITKPETTARDLKKQGIEVLMAEFTTNLDPKQEGRNININIAAKQIDGTPLPPGEVFSFNKIVGPRTASRGFKTATVIENGNLVQGIGGGICQVATTLYNAYMLAGLPTVERVIHSNYIAAYPTGRDASVADRLYDLKFKNDTNSYLLIKAILKDASFIIRIYGPKNGRQNYFSEPQISSIVPYQIKLDPDGSLPPGVKVREQKGVAGRTIKLKRTVKLNGQILFEEDIISKYQPRPEIIRTGPEETTPTI